MASQSRELYLTNDMALNNILSKIATRLDTIEGLLPDLDAGLYQLGSNKAISTANISGESNKIEVEDNAISLASPLYIGSQSEIESGNYAEFEDDGTMEMHGDATVWDDINFDPDRAGGPAATLPDYVTINDVIHREFTSANNQLCGSVKEIPHNAKLSQKLYPHIHLFMKSGEAVGTTGVTFTFYWELRQSAGTTSGSVTLSATSAQLSANAHKIDIFDLTGFTGPSELGSQLSSKIARTAGDAGDIIVTTYGIHYEIDTIGSREITTK